jgi:hypothetical protein
MTYIIGTVSLISRKKIVPGHLTEPSSGAITDIADTGLLGYPAAIS